MSDIFNSLPVSIKALTILGVLIAALVFLNAVVRRGSILKLNWFKGTGSVKGQKPIGNSATTGKLIARKGAATRIVNQTGSTSTFNGGDVVGDTATETITQKEH